LDARDTRRPAYWACRATTALHAPATIYGNGVYGTTGTEHGFYGNGYGNGYENGNVTLETRCHLHCLCRWRRIRRIFWRHRRNSFVDDASNKIRRRRNVFDVDDSSANFPTTSYTSSEQFLAKRQRTAFARSFVVSATAKTQLLVFGSHESSWLNLLPLHEYALLSLTESAVNKTSWCWLLYIRMFPTQSP